MNKSVLNGNHDRALALLLLLPLLYPFEFELLCNQFVMRLWHQLRQCDHQQQSCIAIGMTDVTMPPTTPPPHVLTDLANEAPPGSKDFAILGGESSVEKWKQVDGQVCGCRAAFAYGPECDALT